MKKLRLKFKRRNQILAAIMLLLIAVLTTVFAPMVMAGIALAVVPIWGSVEAKTFKELTGEQVAELEPDEQVKYFNELNIYKAHKIDELKMELEKSNSETIKKEIETLREEVKQDNKEQMSALVKTIETQGIALTKLMNERGAVPSQKSIEDHLYAVKDKLLKALEETVTIKTDVTTSSLTDSAYALDVPGVGQIATLKTKLWQLFGKGSIGDGQGDVVRYVDQLAVTRNAAFVSEAGQKPESAITWVVKTCPLETIADTIPVTKQALSNIPFIASEIRNFLLKNLALHIDSQLWNGDGTPPNITGVYTYADEYVAAASGITDANVYDLISKMRTNIMATSDYEPDFILMNPNDVTNYLQLKKDGNNNYMLPPFVEMRNGKMFVHGMEIIQSSNVTADTMLVGDFSYAIAYTHGGISIDIGMIDKQFIENMVTLRAEQVLGLVVRSVHENAFNKETGIAAALVTLAS